MLKYTTLTILFLLFSLGIMAQSWANTEKYKEVNSNMKDPIQGEKRVVFIGNSITEAWNRFMPEFFDENKYINRGISGQTTPQMLSRFRPDVIALKPTIVVILAGTNDIAENSGPITLGAILDNIISMVELAKINKIEVILCSVLPAFDFPWRSGLEPAQKIIDLNLLIKSYAHKNNIAFVDYFAGMVDNRNGLKKEYTYDGVHPNLEGYKFMTPIIQNTIFQFTGKMK